MPVKDKVSVIIPVYNGEKFINLCIDSVLNQTYKNFEIIAINDGSTDSTLALLNKYKCTNLKVINIRENKGQAAAINLGLSQCDGEFIAYLDSDDTMLPNRLEEQVNILLNNKKVGLVFSDANYIDMVNNNSKKNLSFNKLVAKKLVNYNSLLVLNFIVRSTVLHRSECIKKVGYFDQKISGSDDWDMWVRIMEVYHFFEINQKLLTKVHHGDNISSTRKNKHYYHENSLRIIKKAYHRRSRPFPIRLLYLSKKLRLSILKNPPVNSQNFLSRIVHKFMYIVDWSICILI